MKYMPQPLITGFTAGIAVIIFSSQISDLLGLAVLSIIAIAVIRKRAPKAPGFLIVVIAGVVA